MRQVDCFEIGNINIGVFKFFLPHTPETNKMSFDEKTAYYERCKDAIEDEGRELWRWRPRRQRDTR